MLSPRLFTILSVLNDLKAASMTLMEMRNKHPALVMLYGFTDICAALAYTGTPTDNGGHIFRSYIETFGPPVTSRVISPEEFWAARSAILHTFSPLGRRHTGDVKPIFYYAWPETPEQVRASLAERGYADFHLLAVNDVKAIAIWSYNGMVRRAENDPGFQTRLFSNSKHLLLDLAATQVEKFLELADQFPKQADSGLPG